MGPKIIAHRGGKGLAPENTLAAFKAVLNHPVDMIEFDVRVTKDGVCILNHYPTLRGIPGKRPRIARHTLAELRTFLPGLATLEEVLNLVDRRVPLMVEVKPRVPVGPVVATLKKRLADGWQPSDFMLASFSQLTLLQLHKSLPEIEKIVLERYSGVVAMLRARQLGTRHLSMKQQYLWPHGIAFLRRRGFELYSFTLNNTDKAALWHKHGLIGVITDNPHHYLTSSLPNTPRHNEPLSKRMS